MTTYEFVPAEPDRTPETMVPGVPGPGAVSDVARLLLSIVGPGRAHEIESVTSPGRGYRVPADVAVEYRRRTSPPAQTPEPLPTEPAPPAPEPETATGPVSFAVQRAVTAAAARRNVAGRKTTTARPKE